MKILLSWSGTRSQIISERLKEWLPSVIPGVDVWMSSEDLEKGQRWIAELSTELKGRDCAIVSLTPENKLSPWILFEAGALSKHLHRAAVCPYLHDLSPADLSNHPLGIFQCTTTTKEDTRRLVHSLRKKHNQDQRVAAKRRINFEQKWSELEPAFAKADSAYIPSKFGYMPENLRVLIVDDFAQIRRLLELTLKSQGVVVQTASEGFEALETIRLFRPEVLITDLKMPGMSGLELLAELAKQADAPVPVVMTAYDSVDTGIRCVYEFGAYWYITKPFVLNEFVALVRRAGIYARLAHRAPSNY